MPFTGLAYELFDNGSIAYYCYYKNGFKEGDYIKFHNNGKVKSTDYMVKGQTRGIRKIWYESEEIKFLGEYKFGICLKYIEWDKQGNIIGIKDTPTKDEVELIARLSEGNEDE